MTQRVGDRAMATARNVPIRPSFPRTGGAAWRLLEHRCLIAQLVSDISRHPRSARSCRRAERSAHLVQRNAKVWNRLALSL